jgi:hypothetical protein
MPTPDDDTADARRERAEEAVRAIAAGADPGAEALRLSNEFTDEWTDRIGARLRRILRRD